MESETRKVHVARLVLSAVAAVFDPPLKKPRNLLIAKINGATQVIFGRKKLACGPALSWSASDRIVSRRGGVPR